MQNQTTSIVMADGVKIILWQEHTHKFQININFLVHCSFVRTTSNYIMNDNSLTYRFESKRAYSASELINGISPIINVTFNPTDQVTKGNAHQYSFHSVFKHRIHINENQNQYGNKYHN